MCWAYNQTKGEMVLSSMSRRAVQHPEKVVVHCFLSFQYSCASTLDVCNLQTSCPKRLSIITRTATTMYGYDDYFFQQLMKYKYHPFSLSSHFPSRLIII